MTAQTPTARSGPRWDVVFLIVALITLAVAIWLDFQKPPAPPAPVAAVQRTIPLPETTDMEPLVAQAIQTAYRNVVAQPGSGIAWGRYGGTLDAHRLYDDAITAYAEAARLEPDKFDWFYLLAVLRDFSGADPDKVLASFQMATSLNDAYPPLFLRYGDALVRQGHLEDARAAYQRAVDLDPGFAMANRALGQVQMSLGDLDQAIMNLEFAVGSRPNDRIALESLARAYQRIGDTETATQMLDRAKTAATLIRVPDPLRHDVESLAVGSIVLEGRYQFYHEHGDHENALTTMKLLESGFPKRMDYRLALADSYLALQRVDEAVENYQRVVNAEPENVTALKKLAQALAMRQTFDASLEAFHRAAELAPGDLELLHNWGTTYLRLGRLGEAEEKFLTVLEVDPNSVDTLYNLGVVLEALGKETEAVARYWDAAVLNPFHLAAQRLKELGYLVPNDGTR